MEKISSHPTPPARPTKYTIKDFVPLIIIFSIIIAFTLIRQLIGGWDLKNAMNDFMGSFFLVFGFFKLLNLRGFAEAYATYDIIAKRSEFYAFLYPFIEIVLGIAYLTRFMPFVTNLFTLVLMTVSALGVGIELAKKKQIMCACLGVVFKIPMTKVTLAEDILMAAMALIMLFMN